MRAFELLNEDKGPMRDDEYWEVLNWLVNGAGAGFTTQDAHDMFSKYDGYYERLKAEYHEQNRKEKEKWDKITAGLKKVQDEGRISTYMCFDCGEYYKAHEKVIPRVCSNCGANHYEEG